MGWLICTGLLVGTALFGNNLSVENVMIAAGLFAVAGSIGSVATALNKKN